MALARLSCALKSACWAVSTVVKSVIPSRYWINARFRELWAATALSCREGGLFLGAQERRQIVLHVLLGAEHGVLISDEQCLERASWNRTIVGDLAVVEDIPRSRRADGAAAVSPVEHVWPGKILPTSLDRSPKVPNRDKRRVEVGLGHADLGALGHGVVFRRPNIRPPAQQVRRNAHHHPGGRRRDLPGLALQLVGQADWAACPEGH